MKKAFKVFLVLVILSAISISIRDGCLGTKNMGIITVPGWAHGVALCERKMSPATQQDEAKIWNDGMATYVVNLGHENDRQVQQLVRRAHEMCAVFY